MMATARGGGEGSGEELCSFCQALPKVELHAHLNGSIRDSTLMELAKELGQKGVIVFEDVEHIISKSGRTLAECFRLFDLFHLLATDHRTVSRITKEAIEDFAAENVVYLELRTTPKKNEAKGMTKRSYMDAVISGLKAVETVDVILNDYGSWSINEGSCSARKKKIYVRLLLSIDRRETTAAATETVNLALEMKHLGVVGIDLSGNPVVGEWETYLPALKHARELGLPVTLHCGEVPNNKEIGAMLDFCPERMGHVCCFEKDDWNRLLSSKIPVEICLTSNVRTELVTSIELHHFVDLYNTKHPISLCTDDPGLFSTSVSNEYYLCATTFGLGKDELFRLAQGSIDLIFGTDEVKNAVRAVFQDAKNKLAS